MTKYKNKFNSKKVYYNPEYNLILLPSLYYGQKGFIKFDSYFEFSIYQVIAKYTDRIIKDKPYQLSACKIKPDFTVEYNRTIIIEAKGFPTASWKLKWKLFEREYPNLEKHVIYNTTDLKFLLSIFK